jgi:hypothetical protein
MNPAPSTSALIEVIKEQEAQITKLKAEIQRLHIHYQKMDIIYNKEKKIHDLVIGLL